MIFLYNYCEIHLMKEVKYARTQYTVCKDSTRSLDVGVSERVEHRTSFAYWLMRAIGLDLGAIINPAIRKRYRTEEVRNRNRNLILANVLLSQTHVVPMDGSFLTAGIQVRKFHGFA